MASVDEALFFCTSDPSGIKVGSGGGTSWLLFEAWKNSKTTDTLTSWLKSQKRVLIHGGGQGRRLPSYAAMGKLLLPIPVYRWERGQRLNQTLLDLQLPLLNRIIEASADNCHTLIASGDVLITSSETIQELPEADIICFGLSVDPSLASNHGVFVSKRNTPEQLEYMLQKPPIEKLSELVTDSLFTIDVGIWLLSDRAVNILMRKSGWSDSKESFMNQCPGYYDLYGSYGLALGSQPTAFDEEISSLKVAIKQIPGGQFYHFGTSSEIISSSLALQNAVTDQSEIWTKNVKPHPAIFIQNAKVDIPIMESHGNLWIENSHISKDWSLSGNQLITGIPENHWALNIPSEICLDISPIGPASYAVRPYGIKDAFRGELGSDTTQYLGSSFKTWLSDRAINFNSTDLQENCDLQDTAIFPVLDDSSQMNKVITWMIHNDNLEGKDIWLHSERISATDISNKTNLQRLEEQRSRYRVINWSQLANNYEKSVFFQVDLNHAAHDFADHGIDVPEAFKNIKDPLLNTHKGLFLSRINKYKGLESSRDKDSAFNVLQHSLLEALIQKKVSPVKNVYDDQIVWSRSPVRIDLAGGWTDTPPYSVLAGGNVVNISLELNGQPPLQAFLRPSEEKNIVLRSIDLGEREVVKTYADLEGYTNVGSPFAIPKAAFCLAGFHPRFSSHTYKDLKSQLDDFGCGLEISFLAAIPKGSGMGTSSILASTILGAISDFCSLEWDQFEICNRTLALEQLLTTGGGWQDQYGGIIPGVKLLQTGTGWNQTPKIRWLPDRLFTEPEYHSSMLLYYTGITRVAKNLLAEIVEGMFLNERDKISVLKEMKTHALDTWETIQLGDFEGYGKKIARSWTLNNQLDADTSNLQIESIISLIDDLCVGYKLPGAGGGGYLYIVAKDPDAALAILKRLDQNPPNPRARFVQMNISNKGMQVSRS